MNPARLYPCSECGLGPEVDHFPCYVAAAERIGRAIGAQLAAKQAERFLAVLAPRETSESPLIERDEAGGS